MSGDVYPKLYSKESMNFFKQIECNFKKDPDGKTVFFPWSYLGRGYTIENPETEAKLGKFLKIHNLLWSVIIMAIIIFSDDHLHLPLLAVLVMELTYFLSCRHILSGCPVSGEKLAFKEHHTAVAARSSAPGLFLLLLFCAGFTMLGGWAILANHGLAKKALGVFCALFFAVLFADLVYLLQLKSAAQKQEGK